MRKIVITSVLCSLSLLLSFNSHAQSNETTSIMFVGNANSQQAINDGSALSANTGIGVNYTEIFDNVNTFKWLYKLDLELSVNVASTVDTVFAKFDNSKNVTNKSSFGNSVLLPLNSGQAFNASFKMYFGSTSSGTKKYDDKWKNTVSGIYGSIAASNRHWSDTIKTINSSAISANIGLFKEIFNESLRKNYSLIVGAGYTYRGIIGDVALNENDNFRKNLTGTTLTGFHGLEIIVGLKLKNIKAEIKLPIIFNGDMPGLSNTQFNTFIGFTGGFPLNLN